MSSPIWVVDPTGNNNPYLKIKTRDTVFVFWQQATFVNGNPSLDVVTPAILWWSDDAITWNQANLPSSITSHPGFQAGTLVYREGMWAAQFAWIYSHDVFGDALLTYGWLYTSDGKTWKVGLDTSTGSNVGFSYINHTWTFFSLGGPVPPNSVVNTKPWTSTTEGFGITPSPPQPAAVNFPGGVCSNPLPDGITAARYGFFNQFDNNRRVFVYTTVSVTDAIWTTVQPPEWIESPSWVNVITTLDNDGLMQYGHIAS